MNKIERQYVSICQDILERGHVKSDRTGTGTKSIFGVQMRHSFTDGFPLYTTKKMPLRVIFEELMWFINGETSIESLIKKNVNIWNGDAYKRYSLTCMASSDSDDYKNGDPNQGIMDMDEFVEKIRLGGRFSTKWADLGPIYGKQWRRWEGKDGKQIDQLGEVIKKLRNTPDDRRIILTAWNPTEVPFAVLPPCHYGFQMWTRELYIEERIAEFHSGKYVGQDEIINEEFLDRCGVPKRAVSMSFSIRSNDFALGNPFNISSYALLLMMIAHQVGMVPEELICNIGDCHLYLNQLDEIKKQISRDVRQLPTLTFNRLPKSIEEYKFEDLNLEGYHPHPPIKIALSN